MKKLPKFIMLFTTLCAGILLQNCKINNMVISLNSSGKLPSKFDYSEHDTLNSADLNWKEYFADSLLIQLIDTALVFNTDLLTAFQKIEESRSEYLLKKGQLFPEISMNASAQISGLSEYSAAWAGDNGARYATGESLTRKIPDYYAGFQSSWEADIWGKMRNKKAGSLARLFASIDGKNLVMTNLIADIANNYYELAALRIESNIYKETIILQENALYIIKVQKETGFANELGVNQFEAELLNSKSKLYEISQNISEAESRINLLAGRFPCTINVDTSAFFVNLPQKLSAGIPSDLLRNRPDIKEAESELMASRADLKSAKAAFYPSLSITAGVAYNAYNPKYLFLTPQSIAYNILGNLTAPLINRNAIKNDFTVANALQLESLYNYQRCILNGFMEVNNELKNIVNLISICALKTHETEVRTKSVETSTNLFRTGRATYLEVLLTQQTSLQSKLDLIESKKRFLQTRVNIYKSLGGGWK